MSAGGWREHENPGDSEDVAAVAEFALRRIRLQSNSAWTVELIRVVSARTQVVAGVNYQLELELGGSPSGETFNRTVRIFKGLDGTMTFEE